MPTLDFKGKPFVYSHHLSVPFRELIIDEKKSLPGPGGPSLDDNLIIHGDNLEALKALLPRYAGKVDVIYIDPPYNTGTDGWAYNDKVNSPAIKNWLGKAVGLDDLERHDKWLCMMWPRLQLLKELLKPNGVIFVSIDDNEAHTLRSLLDEVFGEEAFLAMFVWKSRKFPDSRSTTGISTDHEYIFAYQTGGSSGFRGVERDDSKFSNPDNDARGEWMSRSMLGLATAEQRPNLHFPITDPKTGNKFDPPRNRGWRYSRDRVERMIEEGRVLFPSKADGRPREKKFKKDLQNEYAAFPSIIDDVFTSDGTAELREIMGDQVFDFPKPSGLITRLIEQAAPEGDVLVLDSFAGSGTTAHSALELNAANGRKVKFILVECEKYAEHLTAERIRRVSNGVKQAKNAALQKGFPGNFTFCSLGDPIDLERFFDAQNAPQWEQVARYVAYTATGQTLTDAPKKPGKDWYVGEAGGYRIHLIYKPDLEFMRSNKAALDMTTADRIRKAAEGKSVLVYAAAKFMSQKDLSERGITFCQLPYSIHRILGDGIDEA
jgi:adenine-specific DNA-methyltransferase